MKLRIYNEKCLIATKVLARLMYVFLEIFYNEAQDYREKCLVATKALANGTLDTLVMYLCI